MLSNKNYWPYCLPFLVTPQILNIYKIFTLHFIFIHSLFLIYILNWEMHSVNETKSPFILRFFSFSKGIKGRRGQRREKGMERGESIHIVYFSSFLIFTLLCFNGQASNVSTLSIILLCIIS